MATFLYLCCSSKFRPISKSAEVTETIQQTASDLAFTSGRWWATSSAVTAGLVSSLSEEVAERGGSTSLKGN